MLRLPQKVAILIII